jgi:hypothetical protein
MRLADILGPIAVNFIVSALVVLTLCHKSSDFGVPVNFYHPGRQILWCLVLYL